MGRLWWMSVIGGRQVGCLYFVLDIYHQVTGAMRVNHAENNHVNRASEIMMPRLTPCSTRGIPDNQSDPKRAAAK